MKTSQKLPQLKETTTQLGFFGVFLLDYPSLRENYELIAIDLSKQ